MRPSQFLVPVFLSLALVACDGKAPPDKGAAASKAATQPPPWNADLTRQLAKAVDGRAAHGLDRVAFALPADLNDDAALTQAALAYASALATGASDPHKLFAVYTLPQPKPDLQRGLAQAMRERDVDRWLESLAPQDDTYRRLSQAYLALTQEQGAEAPGPAGGRRAREIAVNMERLRWLERDPPATRIDVDIAAAQLAYWRDGKLIDSRRVIVGEPDTATPQLGSPIKHLVANPSWTVPRSIERRELAGKGDGYLRSRNMSWKDGRIVQAAGPHNSLGRVKFDMANDHAIYLHDTPAKQLFSEAERQRSHGCVRVQDAEGFAELVAEQEGVSAEWRRARAKGDDKFVQLPEPIPVRLLYFTVQLDANGEPVAGPDPYGWDSRVAKAIGFAGEVQARAKARPAEPGP